MPQAWLALPLLSAVLYSLSAVFLRRAERMGVGTVAIMLVTNAVTALAFGLYYPWADFPAAPAVLWPVLGVALTFVAGQWFTLLAFTKGEVSVATPTLGTKVLMVALLAAVFTDRPPGPLTWAAAGLMVVGLLLLIGRPKVQDAAAARAGVGLALLAAGAYAGFDILVQGWSKRIGFGLLVPPGMVLAAVLSLGLLPLAKRPAAPPKPGRCRWLVPGVALMAAQAMVLVWTIGEWEDATTANVVYASRALWSVLLVAALGGVMRDREGMTGRAAVLRRAAGAVVMTAGVALAVV